MVLNMKLKYLLIAIASVALCACKTTALTVPVEQRIEHGNFGTEQMEFIGFKNVNKNNVFIKTYGQELERSHLAINKQDYYMGVYSLQELATYKSSKRYLAFIDVVTQQYLYNDAVADKPNLALGGWLIAGLTCFTLFPVYVPMICCSSKNECEMTLAGEYVLYLYDTTTNEIALTVPMSINVSERYKGQYSNNATNIRSIQDRYRTMLFNLWNENFVKAHRFIEDLEK